jgi:hypothetical protein
MYNSHSYYFQYEKEKEYKKWKGGHAMRFMCNTKSRLLSETTAQIP